jgi:2-polyprenyl-3-methyl-5-hydroxy-6-metoxy-1,4-benzoquinol methylase
VASVTGARPALSVIERAVVDRLPHLQISRGARVLDAPCGNGALTLALRDAGYDAWGTDVVPVACERLGAKFLVADLGAGIPCAPESMDLVLSIEGIEHVENPYAFLRDVHRVLRPGGLLILTTPNIVSLRSRTRFLGSGFYNQDPRPLNEAVRHPLHHISLRTFPELRYALHTAHLTLVDVGHTHIKPVSLLYSIFVPAAAIYTTMAFRKEKDASQRSRNREIRRALLSKSVLFGENLLLVARRD